MIFKPSSSLKILQTQKIFASFPHFLRYTIKQSSIKQKMNKQIENIWNDFHQELKSLASCFL